jgi:hypothetical protein
MGASMLTVVARDDALRSARGRMSDGGASRLLGHDMYVVKWTSVIQ